MHRHPKHITDRSTIDLLTLPYPFSQVPMMTEADFCRAAVQRGITLSGGHDLDRSALEELHRHQIIVPFYCVSIAGPSVAPTVDVSASLTASRVLNTIVTELYRAAAEGRAGDPSAMPFRSWPTERQRTTWPSVEQGYLYSQHQLLGLRAARGYIAELRPRKTRDRQYRWVLPRGMAPHVSNVDEFRFLRSLAIALSALDTRSWPFITQRIHHDPDAWRTANLQRSPRELGDWLGIDAEQLCKRSEMPRLQASSRDVLGDFYDRVRRANPSVWDSLKGEARCAMDLRLAAEVFDRFADELEGPRAAGRQAMREPLSEQGLGLRPKSLDRVLTELHLSPHPPLVVALEGKTEMRIFPRVLELLGLSIDPTWVKLVDFEGTKDLSLLARFAAQPLLGEDRGGFVMLDRPVTRFLVVTDAENRYATRAARERQRQLLLASVTKDLPENLGHDFVSQDARIVEFFTWGRLPFEFAHFTSRQLADALISLASDPYPGGRDGLIADVERIRRSRRPNVDRIWPDAGIRNLKLALADELWPVLQRRIERAITRGTSGPPVMRAAGLAYDLAMLTYRQNMSVRRYGGDAHM